MQRSPSKHLNDNDVILGLNLGDLMSIAGVFIISANIIKIFTASQTAALIPVGISAFYFVILIGVRQRFRRGIFRDLFLKALFILTIGKERYATKHCREFRSRWF